MPLENWWWRYFPEIVFDTNRMWPSKLPTPVRLFPRPIFYSAIY
jgi:hypothetical protein